MLREPYSVYYWHCRPEYPHKYTAHHAIAGFTLHSSLFTLHASLVIHCSVEPSFELFDHTADIGIRAWAGALPELAVVMGDGLYAVIGELVPARGAAGEPRELKIELHHADTAVLLRDYLDELLVLFDRDHRLVTVANVSTFGEGRLVAVLETALVDDERSVYHHEVKAITYHELDIHPIPGGFEAAVIVDI